MHCCAVQELSSALHPAYHWCMPNRLDLPHAEPCCSGRCSKSCTDKPTRQTADPSHPSKQAASTFSNARPAAPSCQFASVAERGADPRLDEAVASFIGGQHDLVHDAGLALAQAGAGILLGKALHHARRLLWQGAGLADQHILACAALTYRQAPRDAPLSAPPDRGLSGCVAGLCSAHPASWGSTGGLQNWRDGSEATCLPAEAVDRKQGSSRSSDSQLSVAGTLPRPGALGAGCAQHHGATGLARCSAGPCAPSPAPQGPDLSTA